MQCKSARLPQVRRRDYLRQTRLKQQTSTVTNVSRCCCCGRLPHQFPRASADSSFDNKVSLCFFFSLSLYLMFCPGGSALLCNGRRVKRAQQVSGLVHNSSFHFFLHSFSADPLFMFSWFTVFSHSLSHIHTHALLSTTVTHSPLYSCALYSEWYSSYSVPGQGVSSRLIYLYLCTCLSSLRIQFPAALSLSSPLHLSPPLSVSLQTQSFVIVFLRAALTSLSLLSQTVDSAMLVVEWCFVFQAFLFGWVQALLEFPCLS